MHLFRIDIACSSEHAETIATMLNLFGAGAIVFEDQQDQAILEPALNTMPLWDLVWVIGYFEQAVDIDAMQGFFHQQFGDQPGYQCKVQNLADENWQLKWLDYIKPLRFGQQKELWMCPEGHTLPPHAADAVILKLNPGLAFGTGSHETTALCLDWLTDHPPQGKTVIDYGCGSGILGIAALKCGASRVYGVDYDPQALIASRENAELNQIDADDFQLFRPEQFPSDLQTDVLIANILAKPIMDLAMRFTSLVKSQGKIVLSGILEEQVDAIIAAYKTSFVFEPAVVRNNWVCLVGEKI